jgi:hypothetical protein
MFVRSGNDWSQQAYLKASNTGAGDYLSPVAIDEDTAIVGGGLEDSSATGINGDQADNSASDAGAAYVITGLPAPKMAVLGNNVTIADGDTTPNFADKTDFGSVTVGQTVTHTFTISNSGSAALVLTGSPVVSFTGPAAADFSLVSPPAPSVPAGQSTAFQICFSPSLTGSRVATLSISHTDADENPYDFAIRGTGLKKDIRPPCFGYLPLILK